MSCDNTMSFPPFPPEYRASGLVLHITSLPAPYGIGDIGPAACEWIGRLHDAGQSWWQALPLGPTGYRNSPYRSLSSFAASGLLVSPQWLVEDELLQVDDYEVGPFSGARIDYDTVIPFKHWLIEKAWTYFRAGARADLRPAYEQFCYDQAHWLEDYALFRALKTRFNGAFYFEWPEEFYRRNPESLARARRELADQVDEVCFAQFLLFRQGQRLKEYAHTKGLRLIGDLPFFVSLDSSDVWANPDFFLLDEKRRPCFVAGVPSDYFSSQGQLWGNPVYNWNVLRQTGYRWCIDRFRALLSFVDVIRLDHFRGFAAAWHVPAGAPTAQCGQWVAGPGADFFNVVQKEMGALPFIAEDLGMITADVYKLRDQFDVSGTRVLQFAFDGHSDNPYLPYNYVPNTVVYTGTLDCPTTRCWFEELPRYQRKNLWTFLKRSGGESGDVAPALMRLAWSSVASLAMAPLQDLLNLGADASMNVRGRASGNWRWRCTQDMLSAPAFDWLRDLTKRSNRLGVVEGAAAAGVGAAES
jgi:4-alpha-glucanotransferase